MTLIIGSTNMGGSKLGSKIKKMWPLSSDASNSANLRDKGKNIISTLREREALKKVNERQNAGRIKNTGRG